MVERQQLINEELCQHLQEYNKCYKETTDSHRSHNVFTVGDLVTVYLRKDRLPISRYNKLLNKNIRPLQVLHKINNNAYVIDPRK